MNFSIIIQNYYDQDELLNDRINMCYENASETSFTHGSLRWIINVFRKIMKSCCFLIKLKKKQLSSNTQWVIIILVAKIDLEIYRMLSHNKMKKISGQRT